jgi:hypothetical protein
MTRQTWSIAALFQRRDDDRSHKASYLMGRMTAERTDPMAQAILAGGCFWCTEAVFRDVIGVSNVESGYIGGTVPHPTTSRSAAATPAMPRRSA